MTNTYIHIYDRMCYQKWILLNGKRKQLHYKLCAIFLQIEMQFADCSRRQMQLKRRERERASGAFNTLANIRFIFFIFAVYRYCR